MAKINLELLSYEQLTQLQVETTALLDAKKNEHADELRAAIKAMIKEAGHELKPFLRSMLPGKASTHKGVKSGATRIKPAVKYKKDGNTWTGRGHQPQWLTKHLADGGTLLEVAA